MDGTQTVSDGNSAAPATFAEAFAADASSASDSSTQSPTPAAAEAPPTPGSESTPGAQDERSPFIPRDRFDEVNRKYNELKAWREQHGWAESVDLQAVQKAAEIGQLYTQDRAGYIRQILAEAVGDPNLAPVVRSEAARLLAGARGQQPAVAPEPQLVPVQLEDGSVVQVPRDPAAWLAWHQQQWLSQVEQKIAPALQTAEEVKAAKEFAARSQQAQSFAQSFVGDLQALPHFAEVKADIYDRLSKATLQSDHPDEVKATAYRIYTQVFAEKVLPKLSQTAQAEQLDDLKRKAAASTVPNPNAAVPSTPRDIKSFNDPRLSW